MIRRLLSFGIKLEILQLTFGAGAICGMVGMALACAAVMLSVYVSAEALVWAVLTL